MFPHRRPCEKARKAMSESASELGRDWGSFAAHSEVKDVKGAISRMVGMEFVKPLSSGNCAILAAISAISGKIMIPDQGGWRGFKRYGELMGRELTLLETDLGVIDTDTLDAELKKHEPQALFVTSFAGYIAEQDIKEIGKICRENSVYLVEDASGAIGDEILAQGDADITVCSTGAPKIVNVLSGGFLATGSMEIIDKSMSIVQACKISPVTCAGIKVELENAPKVVETLVKYSNIIKGELENVVHADKRGVSVGLLVDDPITFAKRVRKNGLVTDLNQGLLTVCPKYDRFLKNGVVVELKKLDILRMSEDDITRIVEILKM